jgi:ADP-ribose pyrophosphatase YjhB (NUDIX family)
MRTTLRVASRAVTVATTEVSNEVIHAAGGIVMRQDVDAPRVAVVWRELRGDWTFPKGKLAPGETYEGAACREVVEETNFDCRVLRYVGTTEYQHRKGRPKVVAYFLMEVIGGTFTPNEEVDELRWCTVTEAERLLTWDRDRDLLERAAALKELGGD